MMTIEAKRDSAFTLIELLVVIAILAILSGLLFPAISNALEKGKQAGCFSNLKQLTLSYVSYSSDYGGQGIGYDASTIWMGVLNEYQGKVAGLRLCPLAAKRGNVKTEEGTITAPWEWKQSSDPTLRTGSYAMNGWLYAHGGSLPALNDPRNADKCLSDRNMSNPSTTPAFMDGIWPDAFPNGSNDARPSNLINPSRGSTFGRIAIARHPLTRDATAEGSPLPGSINMAFVDGHVELARLQDLRRYTWHATYVPNTDPW